MIYISDFILINFILVRNDQTVRSRILLESTENKPKLASPWEHAEMEVG
jgi:hypothetical protein